MKFPVTLLALAALSAPALAQTGAGGPPPTTAAKPAVAASPTSQAAHANQMIEANFAKADRNHDGKVTRDEAKDGMPAVTKNFDQIDTAKTGALTLAQIESYFGARRAERQAERDKRHAQVRAKAAAKATATPAKP